jgi:hypothetical protein
MQNSIRIAIVLVFTSSGLLVGCQNNSVANSNSGNPNAIGGVFPEENSLTSLAKAQGSPNPVFHGSQIGDVCVAVNLETTPHRETSQTLLWFELQLNNQIQTVSPTNYWIVIDKPVIEIVCWQGVLSPGKYSASYRFLIMGDFVAQQYDWDFEVIP